MGKKFTCAMCNGEFEADWSEEAAIAEKNENFGNIEGYSDMEHCDSVCDDCYKIIMAKGCPTITDGRTEQIIN